MNKIISKKQKFFFEKIQSKSNSYRWAWMRKKEGFKEYDMIKKINY